MGPLPALHLVTDDSVLTRPDLLVRAGEVMAAGGREVAVHVRGPRAGGRWLFDVAARLAALARRHGARLLVNDRVDVALAVGADGVQLGARSLPPADARRLLGPGRWIGASVHDLEEARAATGSGADFLLLGTLYAGASHPGRPGAGPARVTEVAGLRLPVVGIGGITPRRVPEVLAAGAHGVAVLGAVWASDRPGQVVRELLLRLER